jgi:hypothetical protein
MAGCKYWYDGKFRSEAEFKQILSNGLLDTLLSEGKVKIEGLEPDFKKAEEFRKQNIKKEPVRLRIINKIQSKLNNERAPITGAFVNNNPVEVLKTANEQRKKRKPDAKPYTMQIVIKLANGVLAVGRETATNKKLREELLASNVSIVDNMKVGIPYMLIPSAYGLYPVQMKSHAINETKFMPTLEAAVNNLAKATDKEIFALRKTIEQMLYQTTVERVNDTIKVTRLGQEPLIYRTAKDAIDYLGNLLYRCDYTKINSIVAGQDYNTLLGNNGAISTDLFSEDGNFFNSSSFVIEAYQMSANDSKATELVIKSPLPNSPDKVSFSDSVVASSVPVVNSTNKKDENPLANLPMDEVNAVIAVAEGEIIREYNLGNSNFPIARVIGTVKDGKVEVASIQMISKVNRANGNPIIKVSPSTITSKEKQEATKRFFADPNVTKTQAKVTPVATKEEVKEEPKSVIASTSLNWLKANQAKEEDQEVEKNNVEEINEAVIAQLEEETIPEEINEDTIDDSDFFDDDIAFEGNPGEPGIKLKATPKQDGTKWNQEEELAWLENKLGKAYKRQSGKKGTVRVFEDIESLRHYLPRETYEMLLRAHKNGTEIHGLFTEAAVLLSKNAQSGVSYHEAFHVIFNLCLPLQRRVQILNEALDKFKDDLPNKTKTLADGTVVTTLPTFTEIEEVLADKFMEYVQEEEADKSFEFSALGKFFKGLYRMVKVFFNPNRPINIDMLFEDINLGVYRYSVKFRNTALKQGLKLKAVVPDARYQNKEEERQAFVYMNTVADRIFNEYRNEDVANQFKTEIEIINEIGVDKFYTLLISHIYADAKTAKDKEMAVAPVLMRLYSNLTNKGEAVATLDIEGRPFKRFTRSTDLLERFNQSLVFRGIHITFKEAKETKNNFSEDEQNFLEADKEEQTMEESWMKGNIEIDPRESITQRMRNFFATIPKFTSNRSNAKPLINAFGVQEKEDPKYVFAYLAQHISDSYSVEDMISKLKSLQKEKPFITHILNNIETNQALRTELWVALGQKNYATFSYVYETGGEYRIGNSNGQSFDNIIKDELIGEFLSQGNVLFNKDKQGRTNFEDINQTAVDEFVRSIEALEKSANDISTASQSTTNQTETIKERVNKLFDLLSKSFTKRNINLSVEDLNSIHNPEGGQASWKNILEVISSVKQIALELKAGKNPFLDLKPDDEIMDAAKKGKKNSIERLGRSLQAAMEKEIVSVFRNIEGKTVYNVILSNFLNKQLTKFTDYDKLLEYRDSIANDPLLSQMPFIQDLLDERSDLMGMLKVSILDGLRRQGKKRAVGYSDMSDIEMEATNLAMFYNNGAKEKGQFKLPIPSDAPTLPYVTARKYTNEEVVERLVQTAKAEFDRIVNLKESPKDSQLRRIPNYFAKGTSFQILPFLNGKVNTDKGFNKKAVQATIEDFINNTFYQQEIDALIKKDVIKAYNTETDKIVFGEKVLDKRIKEADKTNFFKNYLLNSWYMNTQLTTVFGGDPAFYKNTVDYQKRYKQVMSPGSFTNTEHQNPTFNAIILKDVVEPTKKETIDAIKTLIDSSDLSKEKKKEMLTFWTVEQASEKDSNNITDAATFISIARRKQQLEGLNRWTPEHEAAYQKELAGKELGIEETDLFRPEKPFYFNQRLVDGVVVPTQVKNSETVLTKGLALRKNSEDKYLYPQLAEAYNILQNGIEDQDGNYEQIDALIFESAIKVGGVKNLTSTGDSYSTIDKQSDGSYRLSPNPEVVALSTEDWRLQQETPEHYIDSTSNFSTQLRNLAIADLDLEGDYNINGTSMKGKDVARLYQDLIVEDLRASFEDVKDMFLTKNGEINYERLALELRKEIIDRDLGQEYLDALAPIQDALGNFKTTLPLYHPIINYKMESLMNSFFKNRVTKQKITGGAVVNATSYGVSDSLEMKVDATTGIITMECMMPWSSRKYFPLTANGEVDIEAIRKNAPELLQVIGLRIPNEDKYSTFNIVIKGFTPAEMGGMMILPREATKLAGLDFDIDKMYLMTRAFTVSKKGNPQYVKYQEKVTTDEEATQAANNIFRSYVDFKRFVKEFVAEDKQDAQIEGRQQLLDAVAKLKPEIAEEIKFRKEARDVIAKTHDRNSPAMAYARERISLLYEQLEEAVPFSEENVTLSKTQQAAIDFIKSKLLDKNFNAIRFNSRLARDNKKLEILQGIFENKNTAMSILDVGSFDSLKEASARIRLLQAGKSVEGKNRTTLIDESNKLDDASNFNINYPSVQLELFRRNMTGKQLIGIFANHNVHHAKAQFTNLRLAKPIVIDGESYEYLNKIKHGEVRISKGLATNVAAVVDNAKEPLASFLNMNTFTANTQALLQRLGVNDRTVFALLNQPAILELTRKYFNDKGSLSETKQFNEVKAKWIKLLKAKLEDNDINPETETNPDSLLTEQLEKAIAESGTLEYYKVQYAALKAFEKYYAIGNELNMGVQAAKADTQGVGPVAGANFTIINKQQRLLEKKPKDRQILGLEEIFVGGADQVMIPAFNKFGILEPVGILNKVLPSIGSINPNTNEFEYSSLGELKNWFSNQKGVTHSLTEKEASMVDINYMNFIASKFPFFNYSQSANILQTLPDRLAEAKKLTSNDEPYKPLLDALYIADSDTKFPIRRIQYYTTGKKPLDHQRATEAWERMLMDSNPKIQKLAHDLVKYTFFANGYGFGPFSFANIVPVKFWTDDYQRQNSITDIQGRTFNEFLESALQSDYLAKDAVVEARFKKQFMQNYADREGFVKSVTPDLVMPKTDITDPEKLNYEVTIKARDSRQGAIISPKGYLVINKDKNPQLKPFGDQSKPIEFVKVYLKNSQGQFTGKYTLYQHSSSEYDAKNREMFEGKTNIDTFTYKPIAVLGHNQFALEFDFDNDITESNVKRNLKVKPVTTISNMEAYESQMQDEAMNNIIKSEERGFNPEGDVEQSLGGLTAQAATQNNNVIPLNESQRFTRQSVSQDTDYIYLFTDNAQRTSGNNLISDSSRYSAIFGLGKKYPGMTQAVIRGLNNAFPITTMVDDKRTQWTDDKFEDFKTEIDSEIKLIKNNLKDFKGIKFSAEMPFGKGVISNMKDSAPKIWNYLNIKLAEIGINNTGNTPVALNKTSTQSTTTESPKTGFAFLSANVDKTMNDKVILTPFTEYKNAGGKLSEEEFLSLSPDKQKSAIEVLNC